MYTCKYPYANPFQLAHANFFLLINLFLLITIMCKDSTSSTPLKKLILLHNYSDLSCFDNFVDNYFKILTLNIYNSF